MTDRRRIPDAEAEILKCSGRRCCICFGLYGDLEVKQGQIAHLDRNRSNSTADNLAFLCLQHHNEYDTRTSQSKGWTVGEAKDYRALLYEAIMRLREGKGQTGSNITDQCVPPMVSPIGSTSLFRTKSAPKADLDRTPDETTTGLLAPEAVFLAFDVTNPNELHI